MSTAPSASAALDLGSPRSTETTGEVVVPPPPETGGTFPLLDTLRAVGALSVVTTHVAFWAGAYTGNGLLGTVFARLDVGVAIFFVLSGFLLSRAWLQRAADAYPAPRTAPYLWKRFLRVTPVFVVTVVLAMTFIAANRSARVAEWSSTLTMAAAFSDDGFPPGLTQMWSLAVEVSFYLALPLLMPLLLGRGRPLRPHRVAGGLALMVGVSVWWHVDGAARVGHGRPLEWLPAYLTWFAGGIFLALVEVRHARGESGRIGSTLVSLSRQPGSCWALVAGIMLISATPLAGPTMLAAPTEAQSLTKHLLYACVGFLVVLTGVFNNPSSRYSRTFGHPIGRRLGWISYGVFCLHLPMLHFTMWATRWALFSGRGVEIWLMTVFLSLVAAELTYRVVERPALRLKGWGSIGERTSTPASTPASEISTA